MPLGRHQPRGGVARRPPRFGSAGGGVRRQPRHDRRPDRPRLVRRRGDPLRRLRLARLELGEVGEDLDALEAGLNEAKAVTDAPSLVIVRTIIGTPATESADTHEAHGYAILDEEIAATKAAMGMPVDETFHVPSDVLETYRAAGCRGAPSARRGSSALRCSTVTELRFEAQLSGTGMPGWDEDLPVYEAGDSVATRKASGAALQAMLELVRASPAAAPTSPATPARSSRITACSPRRSRRPTDLFRCARARNGRNRKRMARHGGAIPGVGTFLVCAAYMRAAVRRAAVSAAKVLFVWTHDSVGVGEDGPTHQPVEQIASLRAIPGLRVIRPADANEAIEAWKVAVGSGGPTALIMSRQNLPVLEGSAGAPVGAGAYVLQEVDDAVVTLVGTGSEVSVCVEAAAALAGRVCRPGRVVPELGAFRRRRRRHPGGRDATRTTKPGGGGRCCAGLAPVGRRCGVDRSFRRIGSRRHGDARARHQCRQCRRPSPNPHRRLTSHRS